MAATVAGVLSYRAHPVALLATIAWSCALVALALCDAMTHRLPTALLRQGTVVVGVLLVGSGAASGDWWPVAQAAMWAATSTAALHLAFLLAGVGRGDVRLALMGGLGMGHATLNSTVLALAAWCAVVAAQTAMKCAQGGSLKDQIPLAPGLAVGFAVAAAAPI